MLKQIFEAIEAAGGESFIVGGSVRDFLLHIPSKDVDVEVFRVSYLQLSEILAKFGKVDLVGKSFGVIKLTIGERDFDFSLPRRESKNGIGHKGFDIFVDQNITLKEAASRRDFTINSMSMDKNGKVIDPYNGKDDLYNKLLTPTSIYFKDDPLRVLRALKFSARYSLDASIELISAAIEMKYEYSTLPVERVWCEWKDWALRGKDYFRSLNLLMNTEWVDFYPELAAIIGVEQNPEWHPEIWVWDHTAYVLEAMHDICVRENVTGENRLVLIFSALTHDFGKATHTQIDTDGRITSRGHEAAGGPLARSFLESIGCPESIIERVIPLVVNHMATCQKLSSKAVRRLSVRLGKASIRELLFLIEADQSGRPPMPKVLSDNGKHLREKAGELNLLHNKPQPLIRGADIVAAGYEPGPIIGKIQKHLYKMQIDGKFETKEEGLSRIRSFVRSL